MSETTDPTAGERAKCWRSECRTACYYPDICSERPAEPDAGHPASPSCSPRSCGQDPAEPDAGDVEALAWIINRFTVYDRATRAARAILASDWLDAVRRKAGDEGAEQIAQAIEEQIRAFGQMEAGDPVRAGLIEGYRDAARIARSTR